jgi:hypothetical protein
MFGNDLLRRKTVTATETFIINEFLHQIGNESDGAPDSAWNHVMPKEKDDAHYRDLSFWRLHDSSLHIGKHNFRQSFPGSSSII